ncbi:helix-turn-helix transcriptional regulator [Streptomyces hyaluromycini]|uniref:Helix-turn-helix transcriptional regulator n=1 Tax=Streptomyces hyaluromycini TaxID=1377993 RepID=A0ABV1X1P8_9ACTN
MTSQPKRVRMTLPTITVLDVLANAAGEDIHGLEVCSRAHLGTGTVYPMLSRLEKAGMVAARWEDDQIWQEAADKEWRPRRRYYEITGAGMAALTQARQPKPQYRPGIAQPGSAS